MLCSAALQRGTFRALLLALLACALALGVAQGKKQPPAKPLDLNMATAAELQQLPGIGPTTAAAIVRFREKSGPFRRIEDLLAVRGITKRRLDKLRPYITIVPLAPAKRG